MIGSTYMARFVGPDWRRLPPEPVVVLARSSFRKGSPRNVLCRRATGELVIRPWRGLRKP